MPTRSSLLVALLAALSIVGCGSRTPLEVGEDVPVIPIDGADVRDVPTDRDVTDVPIPTGCRSNTDCAGTPATPVCDTTTAVCVECLTAPDNCAAGTICDGAIHRCVPGCRTDRDCGGANPHCRQDTHECVECLMATDCPGRGALCQNFRCTRPCMGMCPNGDACCDALCADVATDPANCGGCGIACAAVINGTPACAGAACGIGRCDPGFANCDGRLDTGCEANLTVDPGNCGACGRQCGADEACSAGACVPTGCTSTDCGAGRTCCASACTPTGSDPNNCGGCGIACNPIANGAAACVSARCVVANCARGFGDCDGLAMNGCESDLQTDRANCGACGRACGAGRACSAGLCVPECGGGTPCPGGTQCCGAFCAITASDPSNCGACGNVCSAPNASSSCAGGMCGIAACARGFGNCDGAVANGCEANLASDSNNCGGCNNRCGAGSSCINGVCRAGATCPAVPCGTGQACCAGRCLDITVDPANCGGCNVRCSVDTPFCMGGACCSSNDGGSGVCGVMVCPGGQTNCGGVCVTLGSDLNNCGGCDIRCASGQMCINGFCSGGGCGSGGACDANSTCCGSTCVFTTSDVNNCGGCGIACPAGANANATCNGGTCGIICNPGFGDCDGSFANGCESRLDSTSSCGMCGNVCPAGGMCIRGRCTVPTCNGGPACASSQTCCPSGCIDTSSDPANCGACGRACALANATSSCSANMCAIASCNAGFSNCDGVNSNGCESNTQSDPRNCGGCGIACAGGLTCVNAVCAPPSTGSEGAFFPTVNPTYLTPGIHNFTTITVPAGAVVYVAGAGANAGTLDLRATGHIQIDGTIDVSGGPGTQAIVASRSTQLGRAGTGGYTGEVRSAAFPTANCEFNSGATGPNGPPVMGTPGTCTVLAPTECITRSDSRSLLYTAQPAQYGGGGGVFTGYRGYGSGGGGFAGGAGGALGAAFANERDCSGVTAGGGASAGRGGRATGATAYDGSDGTLGQTQCDATMPGIPRAWVGGGGGGSIGTAAAGDLAVTSTFYPGSGGGGGSADYLQRPAFGGTSGGGGGGGVLRLWTPADIVVSGSLLAKGGEGGDAYLGTPASAGCDPQPGSAGGGGSGGLIYLVAPTITSTATAVVSTAGGRGGDASVFATGGRGGAGGVGRVRVSVNPSTCALAGTFTPALASGCTPAPARAGNAYLAAYPN